MLKQKIKIVEIQYEEVGVFYLSVKLGCGVAGKSNIELKKLKLK
jgi:hypothetical protein